MGNKKRGLFWIFFLLVLVSWVWAEEGCYLYEESMLYCFDLEREDALEECMGYEDCRLENVFFEGKSCEDLISFPECDEVFCKSSCDYEFLGKCLGGAVLEGEEYIWCSAGCCRFEYYEREFCGFRESKWLCEMEAKNKEAGEFSFDPAINKEECEHICSEAAILGEKVTEGLIMEEVSEEEIVPEIEVVVEEKEKIPPQTPAPTPELFTEEKKEEVTEELEKGIRMSWILFYFVLFLLLLITVYLVYRKNKPEKEEVKPKVEKVKRPRFFFRKKAIKEREERLKKIKEEREHKRREKEREELFGLFGFGEVKERKISHVDLLEKVAKAHELRKHRWAKEEKEEKDIFREIRKWAKKKEEKAGKSAEEEAKKVFERLKKIIEKKE